MLEKFVFTASEKIANDNGKDFSNLSKLLETMRQYGTVESYDTNMAAVKSAYQTEYDALKLRYDQIKDQKLTNSEIQAVNLLRTLMAEETARYAAEVEAVKSQYSAENEALKKQLEDIKSEHESRIAKIAAALA